MDLNAESEEEAQPSVLIEDVELEHNLSTGTCLDEQTPEVIENLEADAIVLEQYDSDIGLWPDTESFTESFRKYWLQQGSKSCRNEKSDFKQSEIRDQHCDGYRHCTATLFKRKHSLSEESFDLTWLCYSESQGKLYCFICKLLSNEENSFTRGFQDWKNAKAYIESHSKSPSHRKSLGDAMIRSKNVQVDQKLIEGRIAESKYWQKFLTRVVEVLIFLSGRGLSICGSNENIGSVHNSNFLGILKLLATYDSFLAEHLEKYGNKGHGSTSYLSHSICDELLKIMAKRVTGINARC